MVAAEEDGILILGLKHFADVHGAGLGLIGIGHIVLEIAGLGNIDVNGILDLVAAALGGEGALEAGSNRINIIIGHGGSDAHKAGRGLEGVIGAQGGPVMIGVVIDALLRMGL